MLHADFCWYSSEIGPGFPTPSAPCILENITAKMNNLGTTTVWKTERGALGNLTTTLTETPPLTECLVANMISTLSPQKGHRGGGSVSAEVMGLISVNRCQLHSGT